MVTVTLQVTAHGSDRREAWRALAVAANEIYSTLDEPVPRRSGQGEPKAEHPAHGGYAWSVASAAPLERQEAADKPVEAEVANESQTGRVEANSAAAGHYGKQSPPTMALDLGEW